MRARSEIWLLSVGFVSLFLGAPTAVSAIDDARFAEEQRYGDLKSLGTWTGFYRYQPSPVDSGKVSGDLMEIPAWWEETDFFYQDRGTLREIPFADGINLVRFLGGWLQGLSSEERREAGDLVTRNDDGTLRFHPERLGERLDPYVEAGYRDITLVLDNTPWSLTVEDNPGYYGNVAPPDSVEEWRFLIESICEELIRRYGFAIANGMRFRYGTEMQDHRRFAGTEAQYIELYRTAAAVVRHYLPGAQFGPFNRSIPVSPEGEPEAWEHENVSLVRLAQALAWADPNQPNSFDFVSRSYYYFNSVQDGELRNFHPDERAPGIGQYWERIDRLGTPSSGASREIHEFGYLLSEAGVYGPPRGAREAALFLQTILQLKEEGLDRLYHWSVTDALPSGRRLWGAEVWLFSVWDHLRDGEAFVVPAEWDEGDEEVSAAALWVVQPHRLVLMTGVFNHDRRREGDGRVVLQIPEGLVPFTPEASTARQLRFNRQSSPYDRIWNDAQSADLLSTAYREHPGPLASNLLRRGKHAFFKDPVAGIAWLEDRYERYKNVMKESLTLQAAEGLTVIREKERYRFALALKNPGVAVTVFEPTSSRNH